MNSIHKHFMSLGFLAAFALTTPLNADMNTPRIDARQENQQERIDQGIASGALTPREAHRLEAQQNRIEGAEDAAKADGIVTKGERIRLTHRQNQAGNTIFRKKHNRRH